MTATLRRRAAVAVCTSIGMLIICAIEPSSARTVDLKIDRYKRAGPVSVYVDGRRLPASAAVVLKDNVYLSMRALAKAVGADAAYDARRKQATLTTLFRQLVVHIGDSNATVNGQPARIMPPAKFIGGHVLLPLRAVAAALGAQVTSDPVARKIAIVTNRSPAAPAARTPVAARTSTIEGTVIGVTARADSSTLAIDANGTHYSFNVPSGTHIQFRDTHGALAGEGNVSQVRRGDRLIAALDPTGQLLSAADIFAATTGTIAAVSGQSMVLTSGKVINADAATTVTINGRLAAIGQLRRGDLITARSDPTSGKVRSVVALTPGNGTPQVGASPTVGASPAATGTTPVRIDRVADDAQRPLRAGQTLHITAAGTSGAQATFDLGDIVVDNPMREPEPGRYEGSYPIGIGTNLIDAPIIVRFRMSGQEAVAQAPDALTVITQPPQVKDLGPPSGARVALLRPSIYAAFATVGDKGMAVESIRLFVNGQDVTGSATVTPGFVSYYPPDDLRAGVNTAEVKGVDVAGNALDFRWSFTITPK